MQPAVRNFESRELKAPYASDWLLVLVVTALVLFGVLMVYSTTGVAAQEKFSDSFFYVKKQVIAALIGFAMMLLLSRIKIEWLKKVAPLCLPLALLLLLLPLIPGLGVRAGGASRWINLGFFRFQPVETSKLLFVVFMASYFTRHENTLHGFLDGLIKPFFLFCPLAFLLLIQPDFGSTAVIAIVLLGMAASAGVRLSHVGYAFLSLSGVGAVLVLLSPYRLSRIMSFLSPFADASGKGYQLIQSLIAVGLGQVSGVGLGESRQKLFFLPAAHTDFIFAVIAEELGFLGSVVLIALFLVVLWRGLLIAGRLADDTFTFSLAVGLTLLVAVPALLNVGVVTGLLPTKGMVLPFVGYGGSNLISALALVGLLLALARHFKDRKQ